MNFMRLVLYEKGKPHGEAPFHAIGRGGHKKQNSGSPVF